MSELKIPDHVSQYLIMSLNGMGPNTTYIGDYTKDFIEYAAKQSAPVLELGAGYGFVSLEALKAGATVIANDLDSRHLQLLYEHTPINCRERLTLIPGKFPEQLDLEARSISASYMAHLLGYLEPSTMQFGFEQLFHYLMPGGKLYILTSTPYKGIFKKIIPAYEKRVKENKKWPGYFTGLKQSISESVPDALHFLDDMVLSRELERVGFIVDKIEMYERTDLPLIARLDGREGLFALARKP